MKKDYHPLAKLRKMSLLSVDEIADFLGCCSSNVRAMETGRVRLTSVNRHKIAEFFKVEKKMLIEEIKNWEMRKELIK